MNLWSLNSMLIFIIFAIPGFVALKAYEMFVPGGARADNATKFIDAVAYSCVIYAIFGVPLYWLLMSEWARKNPTVSTLALTLVFFGVPVIAAALWRLMRQSKLFQSIAPHPTLKPWDYVFSQRKPYWIKVHLTDGHIYAGKFSANSFASSPPADEEIFLEECWLLNEKGGFDRAKKRSAGLLLLKGQIKAVELFHFD
jgi:hypothetical protein